MYLPGVNLPIDSSPAVSQQPHLLGVFGQHHVAPGPGSAHLAVPVTHFGQFCLHGGQNILLLIQLCFDILSIDKAKRQKNQTEKSDQET